MTFTIIDTITNTTYAIDFDTLDDLITLRDKYGDSQMMLDIINMTITIIGNNA